MELATLYNLGSLRYRDMRNDLPSPTETLATNLTRLMKERKVVDRDVESKSGVGAKTVNNIRNGRHGATLANISAVARSLHTQPWMLLVPDADMELLANGSLHRLIQNYLAADDRGRETIGQVAESAAITANRLTA